MTEKERELIRDLAVILDCCLDWLDEKAAEEVWNDDGGGLRPITWQKRFAKAESAVNEAFELLGLE